MIARMRHKMHRTRGIDKHEGARRTANSPEIAKRMKAEKATGDTLHTEMCGRA
jgi:hypothetical protein